MLQIYFYQSVHWGSSFNKIHNYVNNICLCDVIQNGLDSVKLVFAPGYPNVKKKIHFFRGTSVSLYNEPTLSASLISAHDHSVR